MWFSTHINIYFIIFTESDNVPPMLMGKTLKMFLRGRYNSVRYFGSRWILRKWSKYFQTRSHQQLSPITKTDSRWTSSWSPHPNVSYFHGKIEGSAHSHTLRQPEQDPLVTGTVFFSLPNDKVPSCTTCLQPLPTDTHSNLPLWNRSIVIDSIYWDF